MLIGNRLKGASLISLVLGVHIIIPKISELSLKVHQIASQSYRAIATEAALKDRNQSGKESSTSSNEEFQPPNNGSFDSDYGSGTR